MGIRCMLDIYIFQCYVVFTEDSYAVLVKTRNCRERNSSFTSCLYCFCKQIQSDGFDNALLDLLSLLSSDSQTHNALLSAGIFVIITHLSRSLCIDFWRASIFWTENSLRMVIVKVTSEESRHANIKFILHLQHMIENDFKMILRIENSDRQTAIFRSLWIYEASCLLMVVEVENGNLALHFGWSAAGNSHETLLLQLTDTQDNFCCFVMRVDK